MIESVPGIDLLRDAKVHVVKVGDTPIAAYWCQDAADNLCRQLTEIRGLPYREAMRELTGTLGFCEKLAGHLIFELSSGISQNVH